MEKLAMKRKKLVVAVHPCNLISSPTTWIATTITVWVRWKWLKKQWRKRRQVVMVEKISGRGWFFANFLIYSCSIPRIHPIYRGWKWDTLSLLRINLGPWFKSEGISIVGSKLLSWLEKVGSLPELVTLEQRCGGCQGSWPARLTLECSTMSSYHGSVWFARFSGEKKH